jgi:hypothetical protein
VKDEDFQIKRYDWVKSPLAPETVVGTKPRAQELASGESKSSNTQSSGQVIASPKPAASSGVSESVLPTVPPDPGRPSPEGTHGQIYYVPIRICFLDTICQTPVIKSDLIETDIEVFRNLRIEYHRALNPFSRLFPSLLPRRIKIQLAKSSVWTLISEASTNAVWIFGFEYVQLSGYFHSGI